MTLEKKSGYPTAAGILAIIAIAIIAACICLLLGIFNIWKHVEWKYGFSLFLAGILGLTGEIFALKRMVFTELGIASLFLGIAALQMVLLFPFFLTPIFGIVALIYGAESWSKSKDGLGLAGLILGLISLILAIILLVLAAVIVR